MFVRADARPARIPEGRRSATGLWYRLHQDYTWCTDWIGQAFGSTEMRIHTKAGFEWDGGSIPRFMWSITGLTPDGFGREGFMLHDRLYDRHGDLPDGSIEIVRGGVWVFEDYHFTRKMADRLMRRLMLEGGEDRGRVNLAYRAVRMFGGIAGRWGRPRKS